MVSKRRKQGSGYSSERFVLLPHWMLTSPAWRSLTGGAIKVLLAVWRRHSGVNNGEISYSVREAEDEGILRSTTARAFKELIAKGFLVVTRPSAFSMKVHEARCWRLTAERYRGEASTKDFMRWKPASAEPSTSISQSNRRDKRSHPADRGRKLETKLPPTVPALGLSERQAGRSQSHREDTYTLPCGGPLPEASSELLASKEFGARLREARRARSLSQVALAEQVGVVRGTVANIERGIYSAGIELRAKLEAFVRDNDKAADPKQ